MEDNLIKILNLKLLVLNGGHISDEEFRNLKTIKGYQEYFKNIRFKKKKWKNRQWELNKNRSWGTIYIIGLRRIRINENI